MPDQDATGEVDRRFHERLRLAWAPPVEAELLSAYQMAETDPLRPYVIGVLEVFLRDSNNGPVLLGTTWLGIADSLHLDDDSRNAALALFIEVWDEFQHLALSQALPPITDEQPLRVKWTQESDRRLAELESLHATTALDSVARCEMIVLCMLQYTPQRLHGLLNFGDAYEKLMQLGTGTDPGLAWRDILGLVVHTLRR